MREPCGTELRMQPAVPKMTSDASDFERFPLADPTMFGKIGPT
jgi:hypothetical protein